MTRLAPIAAVLALTLSSGCAALKSVSMTPLPAESGSPVYAEIETPVTVIFAQQDHDYVDDLRTELASKCANGRVEGILVKNEQILYWGPLIYKTRISATGSCLRNEAPNS